MRVQGWAHLDYGGALAGLVLVALSMTPSMLPRPVYYQGLISGLSFGIGYLIGVVAWRILTAIVRYRSEWLSRHGWMILLGVWAAAFVVLTSLATRWQNGVRTSVGLPELAGYEGWLLAVISVVTAAACVGVGRALRRLYRWMRSAAGRAFPGHNRGRRATISTVTVIMLSAGIALSLIAIVATTVLVLDWRWDARNASFEADVSQPESPLKSGGPGSLVTWEDLGRKGRSVIASGPTADQIRGVIGQEAREPIRVYVGLDSAPTPQARAELAVDELTRTHAEQREILVLPGLTGTGWIEPQAIDTLEYLHAGNTAMVAAQYSVSPSWVSHVFHPDESRIGTLALFEAVSAWWSQLPVDDRPLLVIYGLSLGSEAMQSVFPTLESLTSRVDGAIFAGTPANVPLSEALRGARDPGSTLLEPVLDGGRQVRWFATAADFDNDLSGWAAPRIAYLQHANDPVVWVSPNIFYQQPPWLEDDERSPLLSPDFRYIPLVTGLQSLADLAVAETVPDDSGHRYGDATLSAWIAITGDGGLTSAAIDAIRDVIAQYEAPIPISQ